LDHQNTGTGRVFGAATGTAWVRTVDSGTGKPYWYHSGMELTTWEDPNAWSRHTTHGQEYFYNAMTNTSVW